MSNPWVSARLEMSSDDIMRWVTLSSTLLRAPLGNLEAAVSALNLIDGINAMVSCECGAYEFGSCESCLAQSYTEETADMSKAPRGVRVWIEPRA